MPYCVLDCQLSNRRHCAARFHTVRTVIFYNNDFNVYILEYRHQANFQSKMKENLFSATLTSTSPSAPQSSTTPPAPQSSTTPPAPQSSSTSPAPQSISPVPPGRNHIFPSIDVRSKDIRSGGDQRTTSAIVEDLTLLSRQKKGGQFKPPEFLSASSCILCDRGCTCIGICCLGPKSLQMSSVYKSVTPSSSIPGLLGSPSTSLTVLFKTSSRKLKIKCYKPSFFKWNNQQGRQPSPIQSSSVSNHQRSSPIKKTKSKIPQDAKYDKKKLMSILLHCSLGNKSSGKPKQKKSGEHQTSSQRKLTVSEVSCKRKSSNFGSPFPAKTLSSSSFRFSPDLSSNSDVTSSSTFNLKGTARYLQEEFDSMIGSAEVFEADNFPSQVYDSDNLGDISTDYTDEENNTEEGIIEILRSSPPPSRKRRQQSQSPQRTATKNPDGKDQPRSGRTPRKDTPTKKRPKYPFFSKESGLLDTIKLQSFVLQVPVQTSWLSR